MVVIHFFACNFLAEVLDMLSTEQRWYVVSMKRTGVSWANVIVGFARIFGWKPVWSNLLLLWKKFKETGSILDRPRSGRPPKLCVREERKLKRIALTNRRCTYRELANSFNFSTGKSISTVTAAKLLQKYGLRRQVAAKRPLLTLKMRKDRYQWAKKHSKWSVRKWKTVLFSDEKVFKTDNDRHVILVTRTVGEKYSPDCIVRTIKH